VFPQLFTFCEAHFKASPWTSLQTTDAIKVLFVNARLPHRSNCNFVTIPLRFTSNYWDVSKLSTFRPSVSYFYPHETHTQYAKYIYSSQIISYMFRRLLLRHLHGEFCVVCSKTLCFFALLLHIILSIVNLKKAGYIQLYVLQHDLCNSIAIYIQFLSK